MYFYTRAAMAPKQFLSGSAIVKVTLALTGWGC